MSKPQIVKLLYRGYWLKHFDGRWHVYVKADDPLDKWLARCTEGAHQQSAMDFVNIERAKRAA